MKFSRDGQGLNKMQKNKAKINFLWVPTNINSINEKKKKIYLYQDIIAKRVEFLLQNASYFLLHNARAFLIQNMST